MNAQAKTKYEWFKSNVSFIDQELRLILGASVMLALMVASPDMTLVTAIAMLAMIPVIMSGIAGWDPLYALVGKTLRSEQNIEQRDWACPNIGVVDRMGRLIVGVALIGAALMGITDSITAIVAIPLVLTALIAWDPFYAMMKVNTIGSTAELKSADLEFDGKMLNSCYIISDQAKLVDKLFISKAA